MVRVVTYRAKEKPTIIIITTGGMSTYGEMEMFLQKLLKTSTMTGSAESGFK